MAPREAAAGPDVCCTYCSADKDPAEGLLPAIRRYRSARIRDVHAAARRRGERFYVLSGAYGLLAPEDEIPWYDHRLLAHEVDALAARMAAQLAGVSTLTYFTAPLATDETLVPYHDAIAAACRHADVRLVTVELPEGDDMAVER